MSLSRVQRSRLQYISRACFETLESRQLLSFSPATSFPVGTNPQDVVTTDFNNDGKLDLATSNYDDATGDGSVSVLLGNGSGSFQPARTSATGPYPFSLTAGDFNADGKIDLATANGGGGDNDVSILLGNGDGTFATAVALNISDANPWSIASGDLNADGKPDLVMTSEDEFLGDYVNVLLGNGDGSFATTTYGPYDGQLFSPVLADFSGDGRIDVAVAAWQMNTIKVFLGDGTGALQEFADSPATGVESYGVDSIAVGDFNTDAVLDLVTTTSDGIVSVLLGNGDGLFQLTRDFAMGGAGSANAIDVNADGKLDLVVIDRSSAGSVIVLLGDGKGGLSAPITGASTSTGGYPTSLVMADFNGDGRPDAAAAILGTNNVAVLLNDGNWGSIPPSLSISDVSRAEGNSGTTPFQFTVSLSTPSQSNVSVQYATASGTATSSTTGGKQDYQPTSGTLSFAPGQTSKMVTVSVLGDTRSEPDETFVVNLSAATNATIADAQGVGTILNDETRGKTWVGPVSGGSWSTAGNWSPSGAPVADSFVSITDASLTLASSATVAELTLKGSATLSVAAAGNRVLRSSAIYLDSAAAKLNLNDNALVIDYAGGSPMSAVRAALNSGYANGAWTGSGIISSTAAANAGSGISFAESTDLFTSFPATFAGQSVDSTSILLRYTLLGDANGDRAVNLSDFTILAANFSKSGRSSGRGNFNYDLAGIVDLTDFTILASNFNKSAAAAPSAVAAIPAAVPATSLMRSSSISAEGSLAEDELFAFRI